MKVGGRELVAHPLTLLSLASHNDDDVDGDEFNDDFEHHLEG